MSNITANDLKTRGIAAIESALAGHTEAVVSMRGAGRFVVMKLSHYHYLRECELEAALMESRADIAAGRYFKESPAAHLARVQGINATEQRALLRKGKAASKPAGGPKVAKRRATTTR